MKRHEALAPLSRDHHQALILAQLLKKNAPAYRGLPLDIPGKLAYARDLFTDKLEPHFIVEEQVMEKAAGLTAALDQSFSELRMEHQEIRIRFAKLGLHTHQLAEDMDALGHLLEAHIRKEERAVFPLIQENAGADCMNQIAQLTHTA